MLIFNLQPQKRSQRENNKKSNQIVNVPKINWIAVIHKLWICNKRRTARVEPQDPVNKFSLRYQLFSLRELQYIILVFNWWPSPVVDASLIFFLWTFYDKKPQRTFLCVFAAVETTAFLCVNNKFHLKFFQRISAWQTTRGGN